MDRYIEVEVYNYATGTAMFVYRFLECEPQVKDIIKECGSEYQVVRREWINGRLCLLVSNAGAVKDSSFGFIWNNGGVEGNPGLFGKGGL